MINSQNLFLITILLACLAMSFYWFNLRPSHIRMECKDASDQFYGGSDFGDLKRDPFEDEIGNREKVYIDCLREHGLSR